MTEKTDGASPKTVRWQDAVWQRGFTMIPTALLLDVEISSNALRVYALFQHFAWRPDDEWPGQDGLAALAQVNEKTLRAAVKELVALGLVETKRRGLGRTNTYTLLTPRSPAGISRSGSGDSPVPERSPTTDPSTSLRSSSKTGEPKGSPPDDRRGLPAEDDPPKLVRIDGRDVALDTLCRVCGIEDGSPRLAEATTALNGRTRPREPGIRHFVWRDLRRYAIAHGREEELGRLLGENPDIFVGAVAKAIEKKAEIYRSTMHGAILTPGALRKWWFDVDNLEAEGGMTGDEMRAFRG